MLAMDPHVPGKTGMFLQVTHIKIIIKKREQFDKDVTCHFFFKFSLV
jgi:hypothetical protein